MSRFFEYLQTSGQSERVSSSPAAESPAAKLGKAPELIYARLPQDRTYSRHIEKPKQIQAVQVDIRPSDRIVFHTDPSSPAADRFRLLRMRLREFWDAGKMKSLLITSPLPRDGKSTIAANLATALSEKGKRAVLLIDADLHHSSLTEQLGLQDQAGLKECLGAHLDPIAAVRRLEPLGWFFLPAGKLRGNPTELLQGGPVSDVMQTLLRHFDWILIDSPPVVPITDALLLRQHTDATLLVSRAGYTPRKQIEAAINLVGRKHILGVVLNGVEGKKQPYAGYHRYYNQNSAAMNDSPEQEDSAKD